MNHTTKDANNRILIIDDNPAIHDDLRKILLPPRIHNIGLEKTKAMLFNEATPFVEVSKFSIESAFQGEQGLDRVRESLSRDRPYALAFVDVRMPPGWDGVETVARLWKEDPALQIVICTAYSDYPWEEMTSRIGKSANMVLLKKPFDNIEVLQLAHALTEKWRLNRQVKEQIRELDRRVSERTSELAAANEELVREIAERKQAEQAFRQAQKMEAVGQLAAGIAHDFNNILTVILGHVSLLRESSDVSENSIPLHEIRDSAERGASLVRQLLAFSRKQVMRPLPMILPEVLISLGDVLRRVLGERVNLQVRAPANLPLIVADLCMLEQVIINLAVNSRDAMPDGGDITISANEVEVGSGAVEANSEAREGRYVAIEIVDSGCGIPPDVIPRIFEPFFTTKPSGVGTGLGLAMVYGIVRQHDGWIEVESETSKGTTFRLFWPVESGDGSQEKVRAVSRQMPGGDETVLVVEDESPVRKLIVSVLQKNGYQVLEAESGEEALDLFRRTGQKTDLLLTDMVLPGQLGGHELADSLRNARSALKVIFMTGYSAEASEEGFDRTGTNLLSKPFSTADMLQTVRRCLDGKRVQ